MTVFDLIRRQEGLRLAAYDDATGKTIYPGDTPIGTCTIGYGHTGPEVVPGLIIDTAQAEAWLKEDVARAEHQAAGVVGDSVWPLLGEARHAALVSMAFELGGGGLARFHMMIAELRRGRYAAAADEALDSRWAAQVPHRAQECAAMIRSNLWPDQAEAA